MKITKKEAKKLGILSKILNVCLHSVKICGVNNDDTELLIKAEDFVKIIKENE